MPFSITCPGCDAKMTAPDEIAGKCIKVQVVRRGVCRSPRDEADKVQPRKSEKASCAFVPPPRSKSSRDLDDGEETPAPKTKKAKIDTKLTGTEKLLVLALSFVALLSSAGSVVGAVYFLKEKEPEQKIVTGDGSQNGPIRSPTGAKMSKGKGGPGAKGGPAAK